MTCAHAQSDPPVPGRTQAREVRRRAAPTRTSSRPNPSRPLTSAPVCGWAPSAAEAARNPGDEPSPLRPSDKAEPPPQGRE